MIIIGSGSFRRFSRQSYASGRSYIGILVLTQLALS